MSISSYARSLIESDVRRQALAAAARQYQEFIASSPVEREWLDEWMSSDLVAAPKEQGT